MTWSCDWTGAKPVQRPTTALEWTPADLREKSFAYEPANGIDASQHDVVSAEDLRADELRVAFEDGFAQGFAEGRAAEAQRVDTAVVMLESALLELETLRDPWLRDAETNLYAIATAIARHVIEREARTDANVIADLVRRALAEFPLSEPVRVCVHPEDLSALSIGERRLSPGRQVQWVADPMIAPGGCLVEGPRRVVDGRIEQVLERIYRALTQES